MPLSSDEPLVAAMFAAWAARPPGRLYLRPCLLTDPGPETPAPSRPESGTETGDGRAAEPRPILIAGGWARCARMEILARDAQGIRGWRLSVDGLRSALAAWPDTFAEEGERLCELLANILAPRAPFAGLPMDRGHVMGIVNVTPDSFSDGGVFLEADAALAGGKALAAAGASILDVGGESTRPGSDPVDEAEELRRVIPVIRALAAMADMPPISVDTRKAAVMRAAADAGAIIVNDVSALGHDPDALATVAGSPASVVLMHAQGEPGTMQDNPRYDHAPTEIFDQLERRIRACEAAGLPRSRICVDPGIGFGKTLAHNLQILASLPLFHGLGCALLVGASRKRFIGEISGEADPRSRLPGSLAAMLAAFQAGVQIHRMHDVAPARQALDVWQAIFTALPACPDAAKL